MTLNAPSAHAPEPCDCLNFCGDDSRLYDGGATPCDWRKRGLDSQANLARVKSLASALLGIAEEDGKVVVTVENMRYLCKQIEACLPQKLTRWD